jgi:hypothetical protein
MRINGKFAYLNLIVLVIFLLLATKSICAQVTVVNIVPNSQSGEKNQDREPNIAVNLANILQIAASAFTPDPAGTANAPIYVSTDGGNTWILNSIVPSQAGSTTGTGDITLHFGGTSNVLYSGILRLPGSYRLNILRTNNFTGAVPMTVLVDRNNVDQPYVKATTVLGGSGHGNDRVYIANNATTGTQTATVDLSLNAATAPPPAGFNNYVIESRTTAGQDSPGVRPTVHLNGTVYAIFYRLTSIGSNTVTGDVIVVRDNNWGSGTTPFTSLIDTGDSKAGVRVVTGVTVPYNMYSGVLGSERLVVSNVSIAVDPRNSNTVYIVWADRVSTNDYTLHVKHTTDGGTTWDTNDIRTITNATNPALAINSRGRVGFLYQQLTGTAPNQRWETRFERTDNAFTTRTDLVLANVPDGVPAHSSMPYMGDYIDLMSVGKNFYGVFSVNNTPDNANFPNGVTYQRNHNFTTHTLLNTDNVTPVDVSIDPFFFRVIELAENSDFYVRDWTDSSTSHDTGLEPSTHPVFYSTCDVWNRRSNSPGAFNANDQPENQDPRMATAGKNYAFARVHRNAGGTSDTVQLHFLYSEFGVGSAYQHAGTTTDPTLSFSSTDLVKTMTSGYEWELPVTTSTHTCLAVEISTTADPYVAPSVVGSAPGWPTIDLMFINDNNKAQRNMGVYSIGGIGGYSFYAIAHNAAMYPRDMILKYTADQKILERLKKIHVDVIGGKEESYHFGNMITLSNMQPGENRWIKLSFYIPEGIKGELYPINFYEMVGNSAVNGFTIAAIVSPIDQVIKENLEFHSQVLFRMAAAFGIEKAKEEAYKALRLIKNKDITFEDYMEFLETYCKQMPKYLDLLMESQKSEDPFRIKESIHNFNEVVEVKDIDRIVSVHSSILHKLDAFLTMLQKKDGDAADILQNVRWQKELYSKIPALKEMKISYLLIEKSQKFIDDYSRHKIYNEDFPNLIRELLEIFEITAKELSKEKINLEKEIKEMKDNLKSPAALQKANRNYLLKLQSLLK